MKLHLILSAAFLALMSYAASAQEASKAPEYEFTVVKENPVTSIKNQYRSGTCWCYSALSFIESEILRTKGQEVDLSEMFVVGKSYHDRAVKYVRVDGHLNFAAGSSFGDVLHVIKDYGIVPQEAYSGFNYGTEMPEQNELDAVLKAYVDAIIKNPNRTLTTAWQAGLNGILDAYFGVMPEKFEYKGKSYTPQSFAASLPIKMDDYISLSSFTHHPFYTSFVIEVPDNWMWASVYNVPLEEMMAVVINENKCMLIRKGDNMWKWINPGDISKMKVVSPDNMKEFEECANKYVEKYKEKIKGIFILQMKESYDEPVILKTGE